MNHRFLKVLPLALCLCAANRTALAEVPTFTRAEAKSYFDLQRKLYPAQGDLYKLLISKFPNKERFTVYEITALTDPTIKGPATLGHRRGLLKGLTPSRLPKHARNCKLPKSTNSANRHFGRR